MKKHILIILSVVMFTTAYAQSDSTSVPADDMDLDFFDMDLEALMSIEVTSVSKKAERLQDVPVSLYVVTSDDIANSGATSLHEVMMLVPGYWGAQSSYSDINPNIRYSGGEIGNIGSVLYLLDGTPIQELINAGLSWENFDLALEDIDRIEVIKGSGGTIYGANSATGVVNIFTKSADKYDGVSAKIDIGTNNLYAISVSGGTKVGDLGIGIYAKTRSFDGYGLMDEFDGDSVTVPLKAGGDTTIANRFEDDYEKRTMTTIGVKLSYDFSEKTKLSYKSHMNISERTEYNNVYNPNSFFVTDNIYRDNVKAQRLVSNLRLDQEFSDDHSLFMRISRNKENDFISSYGGYYTANSIYDFEVQDNITIAEFNSISVGANYRMVNFDVHDFNAPEQAGYIDPQANEQIIGAFLQDKLTFLDGKLNITLGMKAEQFTLVNDNFYISPQAKFTYIPVKELTLWGGYSKSYTTPGFTQTNLDLSLFQVPAYQFFYAQMAPIVIPAVTQGVYDGVYTSAIDNGADDAAATVAAQNYVDSDDGKATIASQVDATVRSTSDPYGNYYNIAVKNGSETKPTSFATIEFGFRTSAIKKVLFEANVFHTTIEDGITASNGTLLNAQNMIAIEGAVADYYLYGNYSKGTTQGLETVLKTIPVKGLTIEASYSYAKTEMEYQENADFDIATLTDEQLNLTPDTPTLPEHILRLKLNVDLPSKIKLSINSVFTSEYSSQGRYEYLYQRNQNILGVGTSEGVVVAENDSRTIINFKLSKNMLDDKLNIYIFGNDILNTGRIEATSSLEVATLSQTRSMFGIGAQYKF